MGDIIPNKPTSVDNKLARELMDARHKLRERALLEGQKPFIKVSLYAAFVPFNNKKIK